MYLTPRGVLLYFIDRLNVAETTSESAPFPVALTTADAILAALPLFETHVNRVDPRARVFIRHDQRKGYYFAVQMRKSSSEAMAALPPTFNDIPIAVELLVEVVLNFRNIGEANWHPTKYGNGCLAKAGLFEPIFVLRAQDSLAATGVAAWLEAARAADVDSLKIRKAEADLAVIQEWQPKRLPT